MRKRRLTELQIIGMIKEQTAGLRRTGVLRQQSLSPATPCKLKSKYGGIGLSDAKRLKQCEDEDDYVARILLRDSRGESRMIVGVDEQTEHNNPTNPELARI